MMFQFAHPVLLALLALVGGWLILKWRRRPASITYSMTSEVTQLVGSGVRLWHKIPLALRTLALVLLVLAAARPQLVNISREIQSPGVDIILCLDSWQYGLGNGSCGPGVIDKYSAYPESFNFSYSLRPYTRAMGETHEAARLRIPNVVSKNDSSRNKKSYLKR